MEFSRRSILSILLLAALTQSAPQSPINGWPQQLWGKQKSKPLIEIKHEIIKKGLIAYHHHKSQSMDNALRRFNQSAHLGPEAQPIQDQPQQSGTSNDWTAPPSGKSY